MDVNLLGIRQSIDRVIRGNSGDTILNFDQFYFLTLVFLRMENTAS